MRITLFLLFLGASQLFAEGSYAQIEKLSIDLENVKAETVLDEIENQSEFYFLYNEKMVNVHFETTVRANDGNIFEVLDQLFAGRDVVYQVVDNQIILSEGSEKKLEKIMQQDENVVSGTVVNEEGAPIPGVSVVLKGTTSGTVTDTDGEYEISDLPDDAVLVYSFVGMQTLEEEVGDRSLINVTLEEATIGLDEVVAVGYGVQRKGSITGSVSSVSSEDLERVQGTTISSTLAGKMAGVSFRMPDGRPGAGANIQIRNMGDPLYVIDGVQKDAGHFNNLSPNDIESISILKDASAAIYGVRAANGVVLVTTKSGKRGEDNTINVDAYMGWQNWTRFPETTNAYKWMRGRADADVNQFGDTSISPEELERYEEGTERGYRSFDWRDFIIKPNAPKNSININTRGGSDKINYYVSLTQLDETSLLGREFNFGRTNIQSNLEAEVAKGLTFETRINGRIESRDNPGVPGGDDYWAPRFAMFRNRPTWRPYANDNPDYVRHIPSMETNWGLLTKEKSGVWEEDWRVLDTQFHGTYETPIEGLTVRGMYSYYYADRLMNNHEYTYDAYRYDEENDEYYVSFHNPNPWRERGTHKVFENVLQGQIDYNRDFGPHSINATFVNERIERHELDTWLHSVPKTNALSLIQFDDMDQYDDSEWEEARIGYIGRLNYNYADKYYLEAAGRRDASWKFAPDMRWGFFPSGSIGWRITEEEFAQSLLGDSSFDLKLRASYGELGDDNVGIGNFDYITGYNYATSRVPLGGETIIGARDRGIPVTSISWFTSKTTDIGADFSFMNGRINGTMDYFYRKREGLPASKYDILVPSELGYSLPQENLNSDATVGGEMMVSFDAEAGDLTYSIAGNISYARHRFLESYKPRFGNSWDHYRNSSEDRWTGTFWGYEVVGQFESYEHINNYEVNNDGNGNRDMLPGDLIYKDVNGDGVINGQDERPIGYPRTGNPILNYGFQLTAQYKGFDLKADFSGGSMYSYNQGWEMRWPYQNEGALLSQFYDDRWHREDIFDPESDWVSGKYPPLRFNAGWHNNYNKNSTFWLTNVRYLRMRTLELGYTIPENILEQLGVGQARFYVNTYNLFSLDNVSHLGVEPEIMDENGLQYPQNKLVNVGVNLSF
ncbi:MAG: TonB-dependent receptor [Marinilabilia sp.]